MKAWYLLYCKPRSEARAQQNLMLQEVETYLPKCRQQVRQPDGQIHVSEAPLFPNYLFIYFDPLETSVRSIQATRGVYRLVDCREDMTPIDDAIIRAIKRKEQKIFKLPQLQRLKKGDRVRFKEGPFVDLEAVFLEPCADKRCSVLFSIMGQLQSVVVPESCIESICA
ncbi:transcription/translation regulatory transformer protein RfaH [Shewanella sedimentimangrovi]|uniref:Transcription antitermination protein RfaH n=1 Tax=Shewanella sedimentimangrovi TaxID=2814293 RepID=A0ABX7QX08_9GAMM|nr:transcription/translation regulatory transformer protein RfaH [Shewanella sedimentimangrovi]QSX36047.1 transcription/translation regulatory transformer protein RfaH [Shewanella sedimentimangrovi]